MRVIFALIMMVFSTLSYAAMPEASPQTAQSKLSPEEIKQQLRLAVEQAKKSDKTVAFFLEKEPATQEKIVEDASKRGSLVGAFSVLPSLLIKETSRFNFEHSLKAEDEVLINEARASLVFFEAAQKDAPNLCPLLRERTLTQKMADPVQMTLLLGDFEKPSIKAALESLNSLAVVQNGYLRKDIKIDESEALESLAKAEKASDKAVKGSGNKADCDYMRELYEYALNQPTAKAAQIMRGDILKTLETLK